MLYHYLYKLILRDRNVPQKDHLGMLQQLLVFAKMLQWSSSYGAVSY